MTNQTPVERAAGHMVTIECEESGSWPSLTFICNEPPGADCRMMCPNPDCEEGCYHVGQPGHEQVAIDYCNNVEWLSQDDDVAGSIAGGRYATTKVTVPIVVSWERGEEGPDWRFADLPTRPTATVTEDERVAKHFPTTPVQCFCGWRESDPSNGGWVDHMSTAATAERDEALARLAAVKAVLPDYCYVFRHPASEGLSCVDLTGGELPSGAPWTPEMGCLPCRIRAALTRSPTPDTDGGDHDA